MFWLIVTGIILTWLPIGWLSSRILNAGSIVAIMLEPENSKYDDGPKEYFTKIIQSFHWNKKVEHTAVFRAGILLGWLTFLLMAFLEGVYGALAIGMVAFWTTTSLLWAIVKRPILGFWNFLLRVTPEGDH